MNLKENRGYVGVDIAISVVILLILIPTITGMIYNINTSSHSTEIKAQAINIAVNAIEASKGLELEDLDDESILTELQSIYNNPSNGTEITTDAETGDIIITDQIATYKLKFDIVDYSETNTDANPNMVKTVKATVTYKTGGKEKSIDISTVLT